MGLVSPIALGELPVVVARSAAGASSPEVRATHGPTKASASRVVEPTEHAPLSGFAAMVTSLAGSGELPAEPPGGQASVGGTGDRLAAAPSVQRLTVDVEAPIEPDIVPDAAEAGPGDPNLSASAGASSSRGSDAGGRVQDAPTLGHGPAQTALAIQRASLTGRTAVPAEPPVQRVEFLTPQIAADPRPTLSRISAVAATDPESVAGPSIDRTAAAAPSVDGRPSGVPSTPVVQRSSPSAVFAESRAPDLPALTTPYDHRDFSEPVGPALSVEPWVPAPVPSADASAAPATSVQNSSFQPRFTPALAVQTSLASAPAASYGTRPVGSSPTVAVGPPLAVQRSAGHLMEAAAGPSSGSSPLVVSRQPVDNVPPGASSTGGTMSFATMFGSTSVPQPAETADDGSTSVQLQSADTASASSEPAVAVPVPGAAPAAAAATPPTDLDEMARRLYEPLSARLRAELWLDRERAGVMDDA